MLLEGSQLSRITDALLAAYTYDELRRMLKELMNVDFSHLTAAEKTFAAQVFELVEWFDRQGRLVDLVRNAHERVPGNTFLEAVFIERCRPPVHFDWVVVTAGEFLMGSQPERDEWAEPDEFPQHRLRLPAFRISRTQVTVAQFAAFVAATGYRTQAEESGAAKVLLATGSAVERGVNWRYPTGKSNGTTDKKEHPVTCLMYADVLAFCQWAHVRLPTEAEWEKAARGGDGRIWPWGDSPPDASRCNFGNSVGDTTPVGSYPNGASPYGALDMAGNVREWTSTLHHAYPYRDDSGSTGTRVLRGGSYHSNPAYLRCAYRRQAAFNTKLNLIGFRVVMDGS